MGQDLRVGSPPGATVKGHGEGLATYPQPVVTAAVRVRSGATRYSDPRNHQDPAANPPSGGFGLPGLHQFRGYQAAAWRVTKLAYLYTPLFSAEGSALPAPAVSAGDGGLAHDCDGRVIMHPLVKCLESLEVCFAR